MLIDKEEISKYRQISKSVKDDKINPHIEDAEFHDVKPLIGELFYNAIAKTPTDPEYVKILEPHTYTYEGYEYKHLGLMRVISIYSYARYVLFGGFTDTPFGFQEKITQDSSAVDPTSKRTIYKKDQETAYKYWSEIEAYLDRFSEDYPLWNISCESIRTRFRISKITKGEAKEIDRGITDIYHG